MRSPGPLQFEPAAAPTPTEGIRLFLCKTLKKKKKTKKTHSQSNSCFIAVQLCSSTHFKKSCSLYV